MKKEIKDFYAKNNVDWDWKRFNELITEYDLENNNILYGIYSTIADIRSRQSIIKHTANDFALNSLLLGSNKFLLEYVGAWQSDVPGKMIRTDYKLLTFLTGLENKIKKMNSNVLKNPRDLSRLLNDDANNPVNNKKFEIIKTSLNNH